MTGRRLYSGFAIGTLFLPACSALSPQQQTAMAPLTPPGWIPPRQSGFVPFGPPAPPEEQFAAARPEPTPMGVPRQLAKPLPGEMVPAPAEDAPKANENLKTVEHRANVEEPSVAAPPLIAAPRLRPKAEISSPTPEPIADPDGVIRGPRPVTRGPLPIIDSPPVIPMELPRRIIQPETPPAAPTQSRREPSAVILPPAPLNNSIIGSSIHQTQSSPVIDTPPPVETILPTANNETPGPVIPAPNFVRGPAPFIAPSLIKDEIPAATPVIFPPAAAPLALPPVIAPPATPVVLPAPSDTPLIQAVRAFQQNKPQEALEFLKTYDQATQQVLISMMPALVQISEGKLQQMKREEMDVLLEQITRVPPMLRARASLQVNKLLLCREVYKFGSVDPFAAAHEFRPGDMVYLYAELSNFSCVADPRGGCSVALGSHLELLDASETAVWKADPREEPENVSTPPQDYYRAYRFCVPSSLAPGKYALSIRIMDKPTGRESAKTIEFRVGAK
ncbi:hypothetical protein [Zavarzinella formosa]|uniref:hypothetical protein n=1 Tax=Zavarzinella formosa TaxID=360055 RepID=UPI000314F767|nr:hypothetical protein [Zavarzinella formosa]